MNTVIASGVATQVYTKSVFSGILDKTKPFRLALEEDESTRQELTRLSADRGPELAVLSPKEPLLAFSTDVILTWPTNYAGFDYTGYTVQSTTNLGSPAWTTNLPAPVVANDQYTVANPISGTQQFFRLSQ